MCLMAIFRTLVFPKQPQCSSSKGHVMAVRSPVLQAPERSTLSPKASVLLTTDCALQAIACNPHAPSLVAAGSANGGVYAWDLSADADALSLGRSETGTLNVGHQQAVHSLVWVYSSDEAQRSSEPNRAFLICSGGMCAPSKSCQCVVSLITPPPPPPK